MGATNLGLVFVAGIAAAFNPCGVAMLPSYVSYLVGHSASDDTSYWRSGVRGAVVGAWMTLGFLTVFVSVGLAISAVGEVLYQLVPWLSTGIGVLLVAMGILMLQGRTFEINTMKYTGNLGSRLRRGSGWSMFIYGILYAIASLGCALPVFLVLVSQSVIIGRLSEAILHFILYALGMGFVVVTLSVLAMISQAYVRTRLKKILPWVSKVSGMIMIAAGLYILDYWILKHHL
ncbi:cytochrome c biogenesis CcdA family protein [Alicyclobacillus sendaiensis]|uniref:cytochrome c biogenesis CcdA family protein n=1 Tax=Alicyclobacillus sendaiensis TaxID=192387 RepID=UPI0026F461E7|nr:cytochrome c biogenesis CcdA family protein [Alicyclobacillus sendaiensis]